MLACAARAAEHWQDSTPRNKAVAIALRGYGHKLKEDYPAAIAAYREALEIFRSISPVSREVADSLKEISIVEHKTKDYDTAERDYREALHIAKKIDDQEIIAIIIGRLAELALDRAQWSEAESLAREALALAEKVGRQELIAIDCHHLAKAIVRAISESPLPASQRDVRLQEALSLSRRAIEIYTRLRSPRLQSAQELLAEIEKAILNEK
ncbi:MAG: tetratricopeptide repeat protein [Anaerolineales bacterium]